MGDRSTYESSTVLTISDMPAAAERGDRAGNAWRRYAAAVIVCGAITVVAAAVAPWLDAANIVMLFLLAVAVVAWRLGRGPAIATAFLSVGLFDFFFVPPRYSFAVNDLQYLLTFSVMLVVALIIGELTATLRQHALVAGMKEERTRALYGVARDLAGASTLEEVVRISSAFVLTIVHAPSCVLLDAADAGLRIAPGCAPECGTWVDLSIARAACAGDRCSDLDGPAAVTYFPLRASEGVMGVLACARRQRVRRC